MRIVHALITLFFLSLSFGLGSFLYITQRPWVDLSVLEHYNPGQPSVLLDCQGVEWGKFQLDKREIVTFNDLPEHLIHAFLAAEDWNFFTHHGISIKGIIRSTCINIYNRKIIQGASTITQQLVKLLFFDLSRSFKRKIKEQFLSLIVEKQFTKEQILETYLNHVYFGCGIYGVQAACNRFWNTCVKDITIDQAATLAGIVRSPRRYCPLYNKEQSEKRRNVVLNSMHKLDFINDQQRIYYQELPLKTTTLSEYSIAPHLKETIRIYLEELLGKEQLYTHGLKIYTTLDINVQKTAEKTFYSKVKKLQETTIPVLDGALITLDPPTGAIRALIGGFDYSTSQFNRALKAKRQIGSTFKPLIYATALTSGLNFNHTALDEPLTVTHKSSLWSPQNSYNYFEGQITLARALSRSNNIVTIKTLLATGINKTILNAQQAGITSKIAPYPSLALGCIDCTLQETASMINMFANKGTYVKPYFIKAIKDQWGNKIYKHKPEHRLVFDHKISDQVVKILEIGVTRIQNLLKLDTLPYHIFGKTGTTNDFRTCWFAGSTPYYTTALYLGCDDNRSLYGKNVYASRTALPLWHEFNKALNKKHKSFTYHPHLKEIIIDQKTGTLLPSLDYPDALKILVDPKNYNTNTDPLF